jgi:hypothetical protein
MKRAASRAYASALMMEAMLSSEWQVYFQRITWHYIPEDPNFKDIFGI